MAGRCSLRAALREGIRQGVREALEPYAEAYRKLAETMKRAGEVADILAADKMKREKKQVDDTTREEILAAIKSGQAEMKASPECVANMALFKGGKPDFTVTRVTLGETWEATDEPGARTQGNRGFILRWETVSAGFGELTVWECPEGLFCDSEGMGREFIQDVFKKFAERIEIT